MGRYSPSDPTLNHGAKYGFDEGNGPTVELVKHFTTWCFCTRDVVSAIGREGLGDSYELQIRYMLAKFVFVSLKYKGWVGLSEHALHEKAEPYKFAVREHWKRLKRSDPELYNCDASASVRSQAGVSWIT